MLGYSRPSAAGVKPEAGTTTGVTNRELRAFHLACTQREQAASPGQTSRQNGPEQGKGVAAASQRGPLQQLCGRQRTKTQLEEAGEVN